MYQHQVYKQIGGKSGDFLEEAIEQDRIGFATQDVVCALDTKRVLYGECLPRIVGQDGSVLTERDFVPEFGKFGIAHLLDNRILLLALEELKRRPNIVLGCNVSSDNLGSEAAWADFLNLISTHRDLARRLVLQVTERRPQTDFFEAKERLAGARALGCKIAINDFGVGFLTPSNLLVLDADIVKIDASLLHDIRSGPDRQNSLNYIVGFASCLAPTVVVQGVEVRAQLDLARRAGATHVQGQLISEPISPQLLKARRNRVGD